MKLNFGARTRNRTKDSFLQQRNHRITVSYLYASIPNVPLFCTIFNGMDVDELAINPYWI